MLDQSAEHGFIIFLVFFQLSTSHYFSILTLLTETVLYLGSRYCFRLFLAILLLFGDGRNYIYTQFSYVLA